MGLQRTAGFPVDPERDVQGGNAGAPAGGPHFEAIAVEHRVLAAGGEGQRRDLPRLHHRQQERQQEGQPPRFEQAGPGEGRHLRGGQLQDQRRGGGHLREDRQRLQVILAAVLNKISDKLPSYKPLTLGCNNMLT